MSFLASRSLLVVAFVPALASQPAPQENLSPFDAATVSLGANQPPFRRLADLDLDGDIDAVGVSVRSDSTQYRLALYRNNGGVLSGGSLDSACPSGVLCIELGHLNADAYPDVCILKGNERHDWLGGPGGPLIQQPALALGASALALALADLDGDQLDDVLWLDGGSLRLSTSSGSSTSIAVSGQKHGLRVLAGDGPFGSTIVLVHVGSDVRLFYAHQATGLVAGPSWTTGVAMGMLDTADIDGDGDRDAVVFGMTSYRVLRRLGPSLWDLEPAAVGGPAEFLRDVDGDGDPDGVCCGGGGGGGGSYGGNIEPSDFEISINDGTGAFAPAFAIPGLGSPQLAGVADIDQDGDLDLVAGRCVYYADGPIRALRTSPVTPPRVGPRSLGDCDGDGDIDVGFSVEGVYSNDGLGSFVLAPVAAQAPPGTRFEGPGFPGDFDGDGDLDLLAEVRAEHHVLSASLPKGHGRGAAAMALLRNDGHGDLAAPVPAAPSGVIFRLDAAGDPERSLLADVDGDGDLDLLTRTEAYVFSDAATQLWANDGTGFFVPSDRRPGARALWVGDADLDGDLDLIECGSGYEGTSTYLERASAPVPGHLPLLTWTVGNAWSQYIEAGLSSADFFGNGSPDFAFVVAPGALSTTAEVLIVQNRLATSNAITLLSNLDRSSTLSAAARVTLADLNGNALSDALIGPLDAELTDICEIHSALPTPYPNFSTVQQLVPPGQLVDLDGDGARDLLGTRLVFHR